MAGGVSVRLFLTVLAWAGLVACRAFAAETPASPKAGEKAEHFFNDATVRVFQMEISEAGLASLRRAPRTYVSGTLREGSHVLTNVAIHLKGMGSFRTVDEKASFAVKFDEFAREPGVSRTHQTHVQQLRAGPNLHRGVARAPDCFATPDCRPRG